MSLEIGIAISRQPGFIAAAAEAARQCRAKIGVGAVHGALVLSAGGSEPALGSVVREVLGPVPVADGSTLGLLTEDGLVSEGVAVVGFSSEEWGIQAACSGPSALDPDSAVSRVSRLILSGRPNRRRFPRGIACIFLDQMFAQETAVWLRRWREFVGPKLKTVGIFSVGEPSPYSGSAEPTGLLSALCLEGTLPIGIGVDKGPAPAWDGPTPVDAGSLCHGAMDAVGTALKNLEGRPPRALFFVESVHRAASLSSEGCRRELEAIREQVGPDVPLLGWLTSAEVTPGNGSVPVCQSGSVVAVAL